MQRCSLQFGAVAGVALFVSACLAPGGRDYAPTVGEAGHSQERHRDAEVDASASIGVISRETEGGARWDDTSAGHEVEDASSDSNVEPIDAETGDVATLVPSAPTLPRSGDAAQVPSATTTVAPSGTVATGVPDCPSGTTYFASGDACYFVTKTLQTRPDAKTTCEEYAADWHLAEVMNAGINADIASLRVNPADEIWLGAVRAPGGTNWYWEDALLMFYDSTSPGGTVTSGLYADWASDQPSGGTEELCSFMLGAPGTWADEECTQTAYAVCRGPAL